MKPVIKTIIWLTIFSIAMGYLETAVVAYLRDLYYPQGFNFPLKPIDYKNSTIEFWREAATVIMLYGIGYLSGRNRSQRFAYFIYCFAIWDLFYYIFLKLLIDWPASLFTWDLLFLIPMPWVGPVLAPCLVSISLIITAFLMLYFNEKGNNARMKVTERLLIISGCLIILISFMKDYIQSTLTSGSGSKWTPGSRQALFADFLKYIPHSYDWWLFIIGEIVMLAALAMYYIRQKNQIQKSLAG